MKKNFSKILATFLVVAMIFGLTLPVQQTYGAELPTIGNARPSQGGESISESGEKACYWRWNRMTVTGGDASAVYSGTFTFTISITGSNSPSAVAAITPGYSYDTNKFSYAMNSNKMVMTVTFTNATTAEIQDFCNNCWIYTEGVENGRGAAGKSLVNEAEFKSIQEYIPQYTVTVAASSSEGTGAGTGIVKVNTGTIAAGSSQSFNKGTALTIDLTPTASENAAIDSYVSGWKIINTDTNAVLGSAEKLTGKKTVSISSADLTALGALNQNITIIPAFTIKGTEPTDNDDRTAGNLQWAQTAANNELSYAAALTFNYNASVKDYVLNSNFGTSWTYGVGSLKDPAIYSSAQFGNDAAITRGEETAFDSLGKLGGTSLETGTELSSNITKNNVKPGDFKQTVYADYYTASSICPNHWYHVYGVKFHKDGIERTIKINKDTLTLALSKTQYTYGESVTPTLTQGSKNIPESRAYIEPTKVKYTYEGTTAKNEAYNSTTPPTMPGSYTVKATYEGDTYIREYTGSNVLTKDFTIVKTTPNVADVAKPTITPTATTLKLTNLKDGQEYSLNGRQWYTKEQIEDNNPFTGLTQNTLFTVQTRIAETDTSDKSAAVSAEATTYVKIKGTVTGRDLPAEVTFKSGGNEYPTTTDSDGNYSIEVPAGSYSMTIAGEDGDEAYNSTTNVTATVDGIIPNIDMPRTQQGQDKDSASDFIENHMTDADGNVITSVSRETIEAILGGETDFGLLNPEAQGYVNSDLTAEGANKTYQELLEEAKQFVETSTNEFLKNHMTTSDGKTIIEVTQDTYGNILGGEEDWNKLTQAEKDAINQKLQAAGATQTYEEMLAQAKQEIQESSDSFIKKYLTGKDGSIYKTATKENYKQILSGKADWDKLSQAEKDAINAQLTANGGKTYEELLKLAEEIEKQIAAEAAKDGNAGKSAKTGDETDMGLYAILAILGLAGAGTAVTVRRRSQ